MNSAGLGLLAWLFVGRFSNLTLDPESFEDGSFFNFDPVDKAGDVERFSLQRVWHQINVFVLLHSLQEGEG